MEIISEGFKPVQRESTRESRAVIREGLQQLAHEGFRLAMNAEAAKGSIVVEALDAAGEALLRYGRGACVELRGDGVRQGVRWKGRAGLPAGGRIRLPLQPAFRMTGYSRWKP